MPCAGRPLLEWSLEAFGGCESVSAIVVAAPAEVLARSSDHPADYGQVGPPGDPTSPGKGEGSVRYVEGGATRAESVAKALRVVETEVVAIHDAARPLITPALVEALVADLVAAPEAAGVIAAAPVTDTIKRAVPSRGSFVADGATNEPRDGGRRPRGSVVAGGATKEPRDGLVVGETLDRGELWRAQTPQAFRTAALREALAVDEATRAAATDEAMLVEAAGGVVLIHPCEGENLKVTTPSDLRLAQMLLRDRHDAAR